MNTIVLPAPKGIPAKIDHIQWMDAGALVHAKINWPAGARIAAMQTALTAASGGILPVSGSIL